MAFEKYWNWGYMRPTKKKEVVKKDVKKEDISPVEIEAAYDAFVEEHILPEPEQEIKTVEDMVQTAKATDERFESVIGELPDAEPSVRPENEAELTKEEIEVIENKKTETSVKSVKVKKPAGKKPGRKKK